MTNINLSALAFALLIDSAPELNEDVVSAAFTAARNGARSRADLADQPIRESLSNAVVQTRSELGDLETGEDDLSRALGAPVEGREIVKPTLGADTAALSLALDRFMIFAHRLPHLGTWADRQAVWNMVPGPRLHPPEPTDASAAYEARHRNGRIGS